MNVANYSKAIAAVLGVVLPLVGLKMFTDVQIDNAAAAIATLATMVLTIVAPKNKG